MPRHLSEAEALSRFLKPALGIRTPKPIAVFVFDDNPKADLNTVKPILDAKGVKASFAAVTTWVGNAASMTWAELRQLQSEGHEILNHSATHAGLVGASAATLKTEVPDAFATFVANGIRPTGFVYAGGTSDATARAEVRKIHNYALGVGNAANVQPFKTFSMDRKGLDNATTLATHQAEVDAAFTGNHLLMYVIHSATMDAAAFTKLGDVIDYIKGKGMAIMTAAQAFDTVGNLFDMGDYPSGKYTIVDGSGKVFSSDAAINNITSTGTHRFRRGSGTNNLEIAQASADVLRWAFADAVLTGYASNGTSDRLALDTGDTPATARMVSRLFGSGKHQSFTNSGTEVFKVDADGTTTIQGKGVVLKGDLFVNPKDSPYNAKGDGIANDTAALQAAFTAAGNAFGGGVGRKVFIPDGVYNINAGLTLPRTASLELAPKATIKATATIAGAMLTIGDDSAWWEDRELKGGTWDCNNFADDAIEMKSGLHSSIQFVNWMNPKRHGLILGSLTSVNNNHEMNITGLKGNRSVASAAPVGSYGIWARRCYDSTFIDCVVVGPERSFRNDSNGNTFIGCHAYGLGSNQYPKAVFSENGSDNSYLGCYADTPALYGWEITAAAWRISITGGMVYINPEGPDNIVVGVHTELAVPNSLSITGCKFSGSPGHRLATEYDGTFPSNALASMGNLPGTRGIDMNVTNPVLGDSSRDLFVSRLRAYGSAPTTQNSTGQGTTPPVPVVAAGSTDTSGTVTFGAGTGPANGGQVYLTFNRPFATAPTVIISPANIATQALGLYVRTTGTTSVEIGTQNVPSAGAANTAYAFNYHIIG